MNASTRPAAIVLAFGLLAAGPASAQNAEDELGNWFIFNSSIRFSDRFSLFTEGQVRLYEPVSNLNELLARATAHYDLSPHAMVGLGYVRADSWPFEETDEDGRERIEHRLYQQFAIRHAWGRALLEHRYRLEQRWLERADRTDYSNRVRYRLQVTTPLNRLAMEPGAYFVNFYNELFLNFDDVRAFDQNRLYVAGGYQFTPLSNLQVGVLWQARASSDFFRLQIFYTHNFDLRDR